MVYVTIQIWLNLTIIIDIYSFLEISFYFILILSGIKKGTQHNLSVLRGLTIS